MNAIKLMAIFIRLHLHGALHEEALRAADHEERGRQRLAGGGRLHLQPRDARDDHGHAVLPLPDALGRGVQRFGEHVHGDDDGGAERVGDVQSGELRRLRGGGERRAVRPGGDAHRHAVPQPRRDAVPQRQRHARAVDCARMETSFFEADEFSGGKGRRYLTIDSDYRWEKGDEVWLETDDGPVRLRLTWVVVRVAADGTLTRELLGLRL